MHIAYNPHVALSDYYLFLMKDSPQEKLVKIDCPIPLPIETRTTDGDILEIPTS